MPVQFILGGTEVNFEPVIPEFAVVLYERKVKQICATSQRLPVLLKLPQ